MTSYNKVNGVHAAESKELIGVLRDEWKWRGLVMSDWFGTYSTSESVIAGQDLEMPGPTRFRGALLEHAVKAKKVQPAALDECVRNLLHTINRAADSDIPENAVPKTLDRAEDRQLLRRVAAESIVLLKNDDHVLPFDSTKPVAVIGPNAKFAAYAGGGSANLLPSYTTTSFEAVLSKCEHVRYSVGAHVQKALPLLDSFMLHPDGRPGFRFRAYDKPLTDPERRLLDELHLTNSEMLLADYRIPGCEGPELHIDIDGTFIPSEDGRYDFGLIVHGTGQLFLDGQLVVDNTTDQKPGTAFFGFGTVEEQGTVEVVKGRRYQLHVQFTAPGGLKKLSNGGIRIGCCKHIDAAAAIDDAARLAAQTEQTAVFVGLNSDWESESYDRPDMDLPKGTHSLELIDAVLRANPNAVIVIQSGTPVSMPWVEGAKGIVQAWYGGNEAGNGIADVLFGDVNPVGIHQH